MHNKLTAAHMEGTLRLVSAHLQLDIQGLVKQAEHQTMHWIENKLNVTYKLICSFFLNFCCVNSI